MQEKLRPRCQNNWQLPVLQHKVFLSLLLPPPRVVPAREADLEALHQERDNHAHLDKREVAPRAVRRPIWEWDECRCVCHDLRCVRVWGLLGRRGTTTVMEWSCSYYFLHLRRCAFWRARVQPALREVSRVRKLRRRNSRHEHVDTR